MNKKFIVLLGLFVMYKGLLFSKFILTEREAELLDNMEFLSPSYNTIMVLNLPVLGEIELHPVFDPKSRKMQFMNNQKLDINLAPIPISLQNIKIKENIGELIFEAKAKIFGRDAHVSLSSLKRASESQIIEGSHKMKLILDIAEMSLLFNFENVAIELFGETDIDFNTVLLTLRKNNNHKFLVQNMLADQLVDFYFTFTDEGITIIKYFIKNDILLSKLFWGLDANHDDVILKELSLTNRYKSETLFSGSPSFKLHGDAFADVKIIDSELPINLIDLPTRLDSINDKYEIQIKLPEFKIPVLGAISNGYLNIGDRLKLSGRGSLDLPQINKNSFELMGLFHQKKLLLRGKFDHSIHYNNFVIDEPKFVFDRRNNLFKIFGKSIIHDIKCLVNLTFPDIISSKERAPEITIRSLQKNWEPFRNSSNSKLSNIKLNSLQFLVGPHNGQHEITIKGKTALLNNVEMDAQVNFVNNSNGLIPILKVIPPKLSWKISDSFNNITQFDDLSFKEPQFIISDNIFYDPTMHVYFNRGINFTGKLLLNNKLDLLGDLIPLTTDEIVVTGTVSDDLKSFIWQAPLTTGLSSSFKKVLMIGPMCLQLHSQNPLSIIAPVILQPTEKESLDFVGNFEVTDESLDYSATSTKPWNNMLSLIGFDMIDPKLVFSLNKNKGGVTYMPDVLSIEGNVVFCNTRMHAKSFGSLDSNVVFLGETDHFWLNELASNVFDNKDRYTILPPLEIKKIAFNLSPEQGLLLFGTLGIFGLDRDIECKVNNFGLTINEILPKLVAPGIEILGTNYKGGPLLHLESKGDQNLSRITGIVKLGDIIEINDPIMVTTNGCSFESNTTIGKQKFGIEIKGNALGFKNIPQFILELTFKKDGVDYFKRAITKALNFYDANLNNEIRNVIADIALLENNINLIQDLERQETSSWALEENKRKFNEWLQRELVIQDSYGNYRYRRLAERFELTKISFNGSAEKISESTIPLTFSFILFGKKREIQFDIDFAHLEQSIISLAKELSLLSSIELD